MIRSAVRGAVLLAAVSLAACGTGTKSATLPTLAPTLAPTLPPTAPTTLPPVPGSRAPTSPTLPRVTFTVPPSAPTGCKPPSLENCFTERQMQKYIDTVIPMVAQFFDTQYTNMPRPAAIIYVALGQRGLESCTDETGRQAQYTDESYEYCGADTKIYLGQSSLWDFYHGIGDAAPAVGLAHEWGHHVQRVARVPAPRTTVESIRHENQADCIAGAWARYADQQGWLEYPDDVGDITGLIRKIASAELPNRDHGDLKERTASVQRGIDGGLKACNAYYPTTPILT